MSVRRLEAGSKIAVFSGLKEKADRSLWHPASSSNHPCSLSEEKKQENSHVDSVCAKQDKNLIAWHDSSTTSPKEDHVP